MQNHDISLIEECCREVFEEYGVRGAALDELLTGLSRLDDIKLDIEYVRQIPTFVFEYFDEMGIEATELIDDHRLETYRDHFGDALLERFPHMQKGVKDAWVDAVLLDYLYTRVLHYAQIFVTLTGLIVHHTENTDFTHDDILQICQNVHFLITERTDGKETDYEVY